MIVKFEHEVYLTPKEDDIYRVKITTKIIGEVENVTILTSDFAFQFSTKFDTCETKVALTNFLKKARIKDDVISDTMKRLVTYVDDIVLRDPYGLEDDYYDSDCFLEVKMELKPDPLNDYNVDDDAEEANKKRTREEDDYIVDDDDEEDDKYEASVTKKAFDEITKEDFDAIPMEDFDAIPMEDFDAIPMEDFDAIPMEDFDAIPMEDFRGF